MGTSADYTGGTGGKWTPYKHAASNFARRGGGERAEKVLARYVAALGGAASAAATGRNAAVGSAQQVAGFGAGLATDGLTATLERLGLGHLVGRSRYDVLDGLLEALDADGGSREDQAVTQALCETFAELYPEDAVTTATIEAWHAGLGGAESARAKSLVLMHGIFQPGWRRTRQGRPRLARGVRRRVISVGGGQLPGSV